MINKDASGSTMMMPDQSDPAYQTTFGREIAKTVQEHSLSSSVAPGAAIAKFESSPLISVGNAPKESCFVKNH